jgi:hypothetical protein
VHFWKQLAVDAEVLGSENQLQKISIRRPLCCDNSSLEDVNKNLSQNAKNVFKRKPGSNENCQSRILVPWLAVPTLTPVCILKDHSHSKSAGSTWASLECQCGFWIAGGLVSHLTTWLLTLQLFKLKQHWHSCKGFTSRLNFHSLRVSVLLQYSWNTH